MVVYQAASPTWVTTLVADGSGAYSGSLPSGNYKIRIQTNTSGYRDFWYGGTGYADATVVALTTDTPLNFSATAVYTLSGTVTGNGGTPLSGAYVAVYQAASPTWVTTLVANSSGAYSGTLPSGNYKVRIQPNTAGYSDFWYGGTGYADATVIALTADTTLNFSATASYTLSGTVTGTGGSPLSGAYVVIYQAASPTWVTTLIANGSGAYSGSLPSGNYKIRIQTNTSGYRDFWYGGTQYADATVVALTADTTLNFSATAS